MTFCVNGWIYLACTFDFFFSVKMPYKRKKCISFSLYDISVSIFFHHLSKEMPEGKCSTFPHVSGWGGWIDDGMICADLTRFLYVTPCCFPWLFVPTCPRGSQCAKAKIRGRFTWTLSFFLWKQKSCCSARTTALFFFSFFIFLLLFLFLAFWWMIKLIYLKSRVFYLFTQWEGGANPKSKGVEIFVANICNHWGYPFLFLLCFIWRHLFLALFLFNVIFPPKSRRLSKDQ